MAKTQKERREQMPKGKLVSLPQSFPLGKDHTFRSIQKRDGRIVEFNVGKIAEAIFKAARAVGGEDRQLARSEERRVGKECRSRWWPYDEKKKKWKRERM